MTARFVIAILLLILSIPLLVLGKRHFITKTERLEEVDPATGRRTGRTTPTETQGFDVYFRRVGLVVLGFSAFFMLWACIRTVDAGAVGIPVSLGKALPPKTSGPAFVPPWAAMNQMNIRTQTYTMSIANNEGVKKGDDSISAITKDGAEVRIDGTVIYHLDRRSASRVYKELGTDYTELLRSTARTAVRGASGKYDALPLSSTERDRATVGIEEEMRSVLQPRGIVVEAFQLRNVDLPSTLKDSIGKRLDAQQQAEQQQFELQKVTQQAEVRTKDAEGLANAQRIINSTLTPAYLQYLYIQALEKTVNSPNNTTVILPFDQGLTPLLNVGAGRAP